MAEERLPSIGGEQAGIDYDVLVGVMNRLEVFAAQPVNQFSMRVWEALFEIDRSASMAVVMRYVEQKNFDEVAGAIHVTTEEASRLAAQGLYQIRQRTLPPAPALYKDIFK